MPNVGLRVQERERRESVCAREQRNEVSNDQSSMKRTWQRRNPWPPPTRVRATQCASASTWECQTPRHHCLAIQRYCTTHTQQHTHTLSIVRAHQRTTPSPPTRRNTTWLTLPCLEKSLLLSNFEWPTICASVATTHQTTLQQKTKLSSSASSVFNVYFICLK